MAFLVGITEIYDADGKRVDGPRADGTFAPIRLVLGSGLTGTATPNGPTTEVSIEANAAAVVGVVDPTPNTIVKRGAVGEGKFGFVEAGSYITFAATELSPSITQSQ